MMVIIIIIIITITITITIKIIRLHCDSRPAPQREVFSTWEMPWRKPRATPATGFCWMVHGGYELKPLGIVNGLRTHRTLGKNIGKRLKEKLSNKLLELSQLCENQWKKPLLTFIDGTSLVCLGHSGIMSFS